MLDAPTSGRGLRGSRSKSPPVSPEYPWKTPLPPTVPERDHVTGTTLPIHWGDVPGTLGRTEVVWVPCPEVPTG